MLRLTIREEAEDSVAALSSKVEVLMRRKEKLEAALAQVAPVHVAIVACSPFIVSQSSATTGSKRNPEIYILLNPHF